MRLVGNVRPFRVPLSEGEWQGMVTTLAELHGWEWWHDSDSRRNKAGLPDLLLWRGPRHIVAELKVDQVRANGRIVQNLTTVEQRDMLQRYQEVGAEAVVWRPTPAAREEWWRVETGEPATIGGFRRGMGHVEERLYRPSSGGADHDIRIAARSVIHEVSCLIKAWGRSGF